MVLQSFRYPDRAPCHVRRKKRIRQEQKWRSNYGGRRADGQTTEAGDLDDDVDSDKDPFRFDLLPGGLDRQIWIVRAAVFLSQKKSWRDKRESVARDPTGDFWVGIHGVSWLSLS